MYIQLFCEDPRHLSENISGGTASRPRIRNHVGHSNTIYRNAMEEMKLALHPDHTISSFKPSGGCITLDCSSSVQIEKLFRLIGKIDAAKNQTILEENLLSSEYLEMGFSSI